MTVEAVIFDFDGLLMDTESTMVASWQHEWRFHGLELDLDTFWVPHGGDVTEQRYDRLAQAVGPDYDRPASHARRIAHRDHLHADLPLRPGIAEWLDQAADANLRLAVASSSPAGWVHSHLARVGAVTRFEVYACGDEITDPKPSPAVYHLALHKLDLTAERAVAVEDTAHGVAAAHAAGLRCIAVPNPHVDVSQLRKADLTLTSARELPLHTAIARLR